ncbi:uncharacterized protein LOC112455960 [Temnothorax curvispinosus]|uniref:Uncharacterized protein LOC112455960 n=1 Tax=Temnothorax curvispinosus TaxID=300111 RepID=A0A6J1PXN0_9HYME|nr:uncharacterized protein LOC112455960 [Temnothorax curvispinosus]
MGKKAKARPKTKKATTCEKLKTRIQKTEQTILCRIQQVVEQEEESCDKSRDSSDSDRMLLRGTRNTSKKSSSPKRDPTFFHANVLNEDAMRVNYRCYCQHFLHVPRNLPRPFSNGTSTLERCNEELSFVQAIVWLKSAIVCASQIPAEHVQQIFDRQWDARGNRHREDERTDVEEQSTSPVSDGTNLRDTFATSTPLNISNVCVYTPQRAVFNSRFENTPENKLSWTQWTHASSNTYRITREKEKEVRSYIIPETDVESIVSEEEEEDEEDFDMTNYGIPEHQCFEFENDVGCSVQRGSTSGIEQMNKIFQKNHADVPSECKFILPARNLQSIDPIFDLENNFNRECFISTRNENYLVDKVPESDGSPKSLVITEKAVSQMSNVNPDKYFDILLDSTGNSPALRMSNTIAEYPNEDSAYSTSRYDIFNYDGAVEARSIAGNKRLSDSEYYSKLQPCKKKTITYETGKISSSIDGMSTSSNGSLESFVSAKDIFQISDGYNDEDSDVQIVNYDEQINDSTSGILEHDAAVAAAESIDDKCTPNIEHRYEPHPARNEKTRTSEKTTASASIIQGAVIPDTNIGHRYNLRPRNNKKISFKKEAHSSIIGKSGRARDLLEKENENEDKIISADWLNLTLESLRIDRVITESTKVILSTLCDKKTMEEYVMKKRQRNIYWKDSLEEEAVNTVLNISDIFTKEKKPNICIKVIVTAIVKTLNEIMRENQTSFTETSIWIYRVQIILEFCNSLPICVKVIDYLVTKLKSLQSVLTKNEGKIRKNTHVVINHVHLVFYALNIAFGKYRTIIPSDQRSRFVEKIIPHVADLWKLRYIDKELEYIGLDLDTAEKRWLNALENSAVVFTKHYFVQFAEKSLSLVRRANLAI